LIAKDALGTIKELEIHYDVDFPFWMRSKSFSPQNSRRVGSSWQYGGGGE
jgi:hypothetical protein